mgnify:FL=1
MPELKIIPTATTVTIIGDGITIKTYYIDDLPDTLAAKITEIVASDNGIAYIEGELMIEMINYLSRIDYYIDGSGNLILQNNTGDTENYSVDNNGDLIYTY